MARGLNKVMIIGSLGRDPEIRYTSNNVPVCTLSVATSESWKDKSGEAKEKTEWHRVTAWRKLAEIMEQYLKKGSKVYIEGKLSTRKWQDKDGNDRYTTEIVASEMQMLDSRQAGQGSEGGQSRQTGQSPHEQAKQNGYQPDFDDDLPF